jgi:hypothetical protein
MAAAGNVHKIHKGCCDGGPAGHEARARRPPMSALRDGRSGTDLILTARRFEVEAAAHARDEARRCERIN